jgi:hypothetical protein
LISKSWGKNHLLALPETLLALRAEEHSVCRKVDWHPVPSAEEPSVKKATGYPSATRWAACEHEATLQTGNGLRTYLKSLLRELLVDAEDSAKNRKIVQHELLSRLV